MIRVVIVGNAAEPRHETLLQLRRRGFETAEVADGSALFRHLAGHRCDVVVLDMDMTTDDGQEIARHLRERDNIALLMVSAKGRIDDRIAGLAGGADVYLVKPVDPRELCAYVTSVTRRMGSRSAAPPSAPSAAAPDAWVLYSQKWELVAPDGQRMTLTAYECTLLTLLLACAGAPVSRRAIVQALGHDYVHYDPRRLEAIVSRLRRKIARISGEPTPLQAAHGFGYAFTANATVY